MPEEVTDSLAYHFYDFKDSRFRYRICYSLHEDFKEAKEKNHKVPAPMCDKLGIGDIPLHAAAYPCFLWMSL